MICTVFSAHRFERASLEAANAGRHELRFVHAELMQDTVALAAGAPCIALFSSDDASAPVLERLAEGGVRYIALRSAGYNHVDLEAATRLGIHVANVPEYSPYSVAEHTVLLMLALNRKLVRAHSRVRELNFTLDGLVGFDMHGKTVGIVGIGRIGSAVVRIMHGFGCRLLGFDLVQSDDLVTATGIEYVDLDKLCKESDVIAILMPLSAETKHLINDRMIALMKAGVMIVNTSRGGLIDTSAVIRGLKSGHIGFLGIDVYEREQGLFFHDRSDAILQDDVLARLMTFPNVLITAHQGFLTEEALSNIASTTIDNITKWEDGMRPEHELTGS
ncbi:MAG: 2-hydroxyacid dehydrogenase [bacterium]|nr:2-hydroxyacid dehydrogenase [bacterium]